MSSRTTWLVDLGNTRLKWARADALGSGAVQSLAHAEAAGTDAQDTGFATIRPDDRAWIASVASPALTVTVEAALRRRGAQIARAATQAELAGVRIAYAEPSRLGVDRFLAMLAVHARTSGATLIASIGTALTIDLLDADGTHHGGLIAPSPTLMRESLAQRAPHLPRDGGAVVDFASDTVDALASGAILSARALIAHSLRAARRRLGATPGLLVAGGGADALLDGWRTRAERAPDLVLEGLGVYAKSTPQPPSP
ncbi:MAG TPA: type III pantothenate kinase [Xanthomonadaceae bacterium]|jgi:type III pantothenate kinase|nr:type III pantothenate kinase [Xanthomonadaceae bacterium]